MTLFRTLFYKKPPDGLLEISEKVYVFDCCFTTDAWDQEEYKLYVGNIASQLKDYYPDASILIFNFREGGTTSPLASALSNHDMTIVEYPRHYEGCPLLSMEVIHHFLRSCESWLSLGMQNVLLMHCERGGWPVLAFMLAALLIYSKQYSGESKTLGMVYKQAPSELLHLFSPMNPLPSQLRYLQYVSRRNVATEWPPLDRALSLNCVIMQLIPDIDGNGGCCPIFRIFGQDPYMPGDKTTKLLFSTPKRSKNVRYYKQAECENVIIDIDCHIQGDIVLECLSLHDDLEREIMMYRAMFNTSFIRSNILILNRDEIDVLWDVMDQFPQDFKAEFLFSEMNAAASVVPLDSSCFDEEGLPIEAFSKVQEMFNSVDWLIPTSDIACNVYHQISASDHEQVETSSHQSIDTSDLLQMLTPRKYQDKGSTGSLENDSKRSNYLDKEPPSSPWRDVGSRAFVDGSINSVSSSISMPPQTLSSCEPVHGKHETHLHENRKSSSISPTPPVVMPPSDTMQQGSSETEDTEVRTFPPQPPSPASPTTQSALPPSILSPSSPLKGIDTKAGPSRPLPSPSSPLTPIKEKRDTVPGPPQSPPRPTTLPSPKTPSSLNEKETSTGPPPHLSRPSTLYREDQALRTGETSGASTPRSSHAPSASPPPSPPTPPLIEKLAMAGGSSPPPPPPPRTPPTPPRPQSPPTPPSQERPAMKAGPSPPPPPAAPVEEKPMTAGSSSPPPPAAPMKEKPVTAGSSSPPPPAAHMKEKPTTAGSPSSPPPAAPMKEKPTTAGSPSSPPPAASMKEKPTTAGSPSSPPPAAPMKEKPTTAGSTSSPPPAAPMKEKPTTAGSSSPLPPPPDEPVNKKPSSAGSSPLPTTPLPPPPPDEPIKEKPATVGTSPPPTTPLPPPPPPPTAPMGEKPATAGHIPQPPPPPLPLPPRPPTEPMKEQPAMTAGPPPPPPPPGPSPVEQGTHNRAASSGPPPPPPPAPNSSSNLPPPPPPVPSANQQGGAVPPPPPPSLSRGANVSGAPAPPPPLFGRGRGLSHSMAKNQQAKKLKPLHWLKLTRAVQGSLWAETQKSGEAVKTPEIDISELENLFSAANPSSDKGAAKSKSSSKANKPEKVQLIDHRRAYNCEIMLSKVKIPLHELMDYVLVLDESALDVDQVDNLIKFCPTKEEMELLKGYKGDKDKLGKCEQFFMELMKVPRTEAKLRVFFFKLQFGQQVSDLRKSLNSVNTAVEQIRSSSKFKRVMQTILTLGNALNQGTARGSAVGFRLDSLLKLTDTRARNKRMTLMHYLCKVLADKLPELLDFSKDLNCLEPASKVQLKYLAEEMQSISKGLEKVVQELSMAENDGPVSEKFLKALKEFLNAAEGESRSLASLYSIVGKNVDALILYFGEDPARCPYEHVVSTLRNFVRMFNQAHEENIKQQEAEKKKAEKEASKESSKPNDSQNEENIKQQEAEKKAEKDASKESSKSNDSQNQENIKQQEAENEALKESSKPNDSQNQENIKQQEAEKKPEKEASKEWPKPNDSQNEENVKQQEAEKKKEASKETSKPNESQNKENIKQQEAEKKEKEASKEMSKPNDPQTESEEMTTSPIVKAGE